MAIYFQGLDPADELPAFTLAMRDSGRVMDWTGLGKPVLDKHSTGGVGDKVSLILAPLVAACGAGVPMLSGRGLGHTGGTLDKLEAIPGYDTAPEPARLREVVEGPAGCAIIGQTDDLAPADRKMYAIRDATGSVETRSLIVPSILSKKLAAGLDGLVMDVKHGSGAFLPELDDARELARSLVDVAVAAGLPTVALITDMDAALGHSAGNALEVQEAIDVLTGHETADERLVEVTLALDRGAAGAGRAGPRGRPARAGVRRRRRALRAHGRRAGRPGRHPRACPPAPAARARRRRGVPTRPGHRQRPRHARAGAGRPGPRRRPRARRSAHRPRGRAVADRAGRRRRRAGRAPAGRGPRPRRGDGRRCRTFARCGNLRRAMPRRVPRRWWSSG